LLRHRRPKVTVTFKDAKYQKLNQMRVSPDEPLLIEEEVSKILRVKIGTVQQWRSRGKGPDYILVGDLPRYRMSAVEQYLNDRTQQCGSSRNSQRPARRRKVRKA
jgi:hypothetical protein